MSAPQILFLIFATLGLLSALGSVLARNLVHAALYLVAFFFAVACQFVLLDAEFLAAIQVLIYIGAVAILLMFGIMLTRNIQGDETTGGSWVGKVPAALAGVGVLVTLVAGINGHRGFGDRRPWTTVDSRPSLTVERPVIETLVAMGVPRSELVDEGSGEIDRTLAFDVDEATPMPTVQAFALNLATEHGLVLSMAETEEVRTVGDAITTLEDPREAAITDMGRVVGVEMMSRFVIPFEVAGLLLTAAVVGAVALARPGRAEDEPPRRGAIATVRPDAIPPGNGSPAAEGPGTTRPTTLTPS